MRRDKEYSTSYPAHFVSPTLHLTLPGSVSELDVSVHALPAAPEDLSLSKRCDSSQRTPHGVETDAGFALTCPVWQEDEALSEPVLRPAAFAAAPWYSGAPLCPTWCARFWKQARPQTGDVHRRPAPVFR